MMTIIDIVGVVAAILLLAMLCARPSGVAGIALAVVLVGAGVVVTWQSLDQQRRQQAADIEAFYRRQAAVPAIALPPPDHPRAGS
jgi:hypothetical protein